MTFRSTYAASLLFFGDILVFLASLWLTLFFRYGSIPDAKLWEEHLIAFAPLFAIWLIVFYIVGLYGKRTVLFKSSIFGAILRTQIANIVLAALYFFLVPGIGIAPKTNLVVYLVVSLILIVSWRFLVFPRISRPGAREAAALIGEGPEIEELVKEVNGNVRYHLHFSVVVTPEQVSRDLSAFTASLANEGITTIVVDAEHALARPVLPRLYQLAFGSPKYQILDFFEVYEEVFDRVPLSLLEYDWFLKHASSVDSSLYLFMKRCIDIAGGLLMGLVTGIALPFVWLALRIEGPGPVFITQERIGQHGARMRVYKFRSMRFSDTGKWKGEGENKVTRVGAVLRQISLDEFPQFINVFKGELSLIGPRNDIRDLGDRLAEAISYYQVRYVVVPGITGWAQINQRYEPGNISPQSIEETKVRLAYDFYYIKHRSLALDIVIALKTMKRMFFRVSTW